MLKLLAQGLSNSEISGELHITLGTVRNYLSVIYSRLGVDNRVEGYNEGQRAENHPGIVRLKKNRTLYL